MFVTVTLFIIQIKITSSTEDDEHIMKCTDQLMNNMHIASADADADEVDVCACCGKEGSDLNICNKCDLVVYCNAACKKKHRPKHKKKCERRAAEIEAELHDIQLFKLPPKKEDCSICFLPLPSLHTGSKYYHCCGKKVCSGCIHAPVYDNLGNEVDNTTCAFCRSLAPSSNKQMFKRVSKRVEAGDADVIFNLGCCYSKGLRGLPQDYDKALELYQQAGEHGNASAYYNIGIAHMYGLGVERDEKKATHYYELAAIGGYVAARHNLGNSEGRAGNWDRATKHWLIAAGRGQNESVKMIQQLYKHGHATKEQYARALQAYQTYLDEVRSEQRDKASAFSDQYKYY